MGVVEQEDEEVGGWEDEEVGGQEDEEEELVVCGAVEGTDDLVALVWEVVAEKGHMGEGKMDN